MIDFKIKNKMTKIKKKSSNKNLRKANKEKNDEFYTQLSDIEKELKHYKKYFKGKVVFCNCDDPKGSNFWKYFEMKFDSLGLKKLISTHFEKEKPSYKLEIIRDQKGQKQKPIKTALKQNGDFRSPECIEILKEANIVITNPPFSLFREYVAQLIAYKKKLIIIGNQNSITYKEIFKLIQDNIIWLGHTYPKEFLQPNGSIKKFGNISWFTNLEIKKRHENLILYKTYNPKEYPKYDNYDAINVDKVKDIPIDYKRVMGVPITFMDKYNPDQFEILDGIGRYSMLTGPTDETKGKYLTKINGAPKYARIIIKNKRIKK